MPHPCAVDMVPAGAAVERRSRARSIAGPMVDPSHPEVFPAGERPEPAPGRSEVRVAMRAAAVRRQFSRWLAARIHAD